MIYTMRLLQDYGNYKKDEIILADYPNNFSLSFSGKAEIIREATKDDKEHFIKI